MQKSRYNITLIRADGTVEEKSDVVCSDDYMEVFRHSLALFNQHVELVEDCGEIASWRALYEPQLTITDSLIHYHCPESLDTWIIQGIIPRRTYLVMWCAGYGDADGTCKEYSQAEIMDRSFGCDSQQRHDIYRMGVTDTAKLQGLGEYCVVVRTK